MGLRPAGLVSGGEEAPGGSLYLLPVCTEERPSEATVCLPGHQLGVSPPHRPPSRPGRVSVYIACVYVYFIFSTKVITYTYVSPLILRLGYKFLVFYIFDCRQLVCLSCEINPVGQWGV